MPETNVAGADIVGVVVVPYNIELTVAGVAFTPAISNVTVIDDEVGEPLTTGTVAAWEGGTTPLPDGVYPNDTADVCDPIELDTTDSKKYVLPVVKPVTVAK